MCYNCGCGMPDDDHGKGHAGVTPDGRAITNKTFEAAGEAKRNTEELLSKEGRKE
jgi:hypothetical protein